MGGGEGRRGRRVGGFPPCRPHATAAAMRHEVLGAPSRVRRPGWGVATRPPPAPPPFTPPPAITWAATALQLDLGPLCAALLGCCHNPSPPFPPSPVPPPPPAPPPALPAAGPGLWRGRGAGAGQAGRGHGTLGGRLRGHAAGAGTGYGCGGGGVHLHEMENPSCIEWCVMLPLVGALWPHLGCVRACFFLGGGARG